MGLVCGAIYGPCAFCMGVTSVRFRLPDLPRICARIVQPLLCLLLNCGCPAARRACTRVALGHVRAFKRIKRFTALDLGPVACLMQTANWLRTRDLIENGPVCTCTCTSLVSVSHMMLLLACRARQYVEDFRTIRQAVGI